MDPLNAKPKPPLTPEARERMRDGQYKGLLRAVVKRKADCSADYAPNFDHGQTAPDFVRSAEAAGETPEQVRSHLSLVDRTLLTLCGFFPRLAEALSDEASRSSFESPLTPGPSPPRGRGETRFENSETKFDNSEGRFANSESGFEDSESRFQDSVAGNALPSPAENELLSPPWGRGAGGGGALKSGVGSKLPSLPLPSDAASPRAPKLVRALALLAWRPLRLFRTQEHWEWLALCYRLWQLVRWRQKHGELTVERVEEFHVQLDAVLENFNWEVDWRLKRIERRFWKVWRLYRGLVGVVEAVLGARDSVFGFRDSDEEARGSGSGARDSGPEAGDFGANPHEVSITNHQSPIANRKFQKPGSESRIPRRKPRRAGSR